MPITARAQRNADRLLRAHCQSRPLLAIVVFVCAFVFAGLPFAIHTTNLFIGIPCVIASLSCSILFIRLIAGDTVPHYWFLLMAIYLAVSVGSQWGLVVTVTVGTTLCLFLLDRLIGDFASVCNPLQSQRVFNKPKLPQR